MYAFAFCVWLFILTVLVTLGVVFLPAVVSG